MSTSALQISAYLRVSAYAIAFFDYVQTLPAEYRLYARQKGLFKLSTACILFIMVRYLGLAAMIVGNTGFFYHGFTEESRKEFFCAILGLRTYAVSRKSPHVLKVLVVLYILATTAESISSFWKRIPSHANSCTSGNAPGVHLASLYYVGGLIFDVVSMLISSVYLWKFSGKNRSSRSQLAKMMLHDGIMYFVALSGMSQSPESLYSLPALPTMGLSVASHRWLPMGSCVESRGKIRGQPMWFGSIRQDDAAAMNVVNIIFYNNPNTAVQASAGPLGFAFTMIFSGRFILNLSEHARDGISGEQSSSRTPVSPGSHHRGFRAGNQLASGNEQDGGLVVKVVQNVIAKSDMGHDLDVERKSSGHGPWDGGRIGS
ncbi:hypothetical protein B0H19DRAFT_1372347 [Mycena capillaripes]|nr:hypothetical protein B0H19DRAFT_1372347 [Mycena capillaripes]